MYYFDFARAKEFLSEAYEITRAYHFEIGLTFSHLYDAAIATEDAALMKTLEQHRIHRLWDGIASLTPHYEMYDFVRFIAKLSRSLENAEDRRDCVLYAHFGKDHLNEARGIKRTGLKWIRDGLKREGINPENFNEEAFREKMLHKVERQKDDSLSFKKRYAMAISELCETYLKNGSKEKAHSLLESLVFLRQSIWEEESTDQNQHLLAGAFVLAARAHPDRSARHKHRQNAIALYRQLAARMFHNLADTIEQEDNEDI